MFAGVLLVGGMGEAVSNDWKECSILARADVTHCGPHHCLI